MAQKKDIELLDEGVDAWNEERENHPEVGFNLRGADLKNRDLTGYNLNHIKFGNADLHEAILIEADLRGADLSQVEGLSGIQLARANLSGAELPKSVYWISALDNLAESIKNTRRLFLTMLLACAYCWLAIATTTDAALITNSASTPLPIIQTKVPIVSFFFAAPILLACLYIYFHIHLLRLFQGLGTMPAIFPDGRPLDQRTYPWLMCGLIYNHFPALTDKRPDFLSLQTFILKLMGWWVVPTTLLYFWGKYLSRHEWFGSSLHILLLIFIPIAGIMSAYIGNKLLTGEKSKKPSKDFYLFISATVLIFSLFPIITYIVTTSTQHYTLTERYYSYYTISIAWGHFSILIISCFAFFYFIKKQNKTGTIRTRLLPGITYLSFLLLTFGYTWLSTGSLEYINSSEMIRILVRPNADLIDKDLSIKPAQWGRGNNELSLIKGAKLSRRNLRYANATRAFLVNADLRQSDLSYSNLIDVDMRGADLKGTNLNSAGLQGANLRETKNLTEKQLCSAIFSIRTKLPSKFKTFSQQDCTSYESRFFKPAALLHGLNLRDVDLSSTNLREANFRGADLVGVNFNKTNLQGALFGKYRASNFFGKIFPKNKIKGSDFFDATGLTKKQLCSAEIDDKTILPDYLDGFSQKDCKK